MAHTSVLKTLAFIPFYDYDTLSIESLKAIINCLKTECSTLAHIVQTNGTRYNEAYKLVEDLSLIIKKKSPESVEGDGDESMDTTDTSTSNSDMTVEE